MSTGVILDRVPLRSLSSALIAASCAAVLLTGCSASVRTGDPTVSKENLEQGIADALHESVGRRPDSVECPGAVKAVAGEIARCVLTAASVRYGLTATITSYGDGKAHYQVQVDSKPVNQRESPPGSSTT